MSTDDLWAWVPYGVFLIVTTAITWVVSLLERRAEERDADFHP